MSIKKNLTSEKVLRLGIEPLVSFVELLEGQLNCSLEPLIPLLDSYVTCPCLSTYLCSEK